MQRITLGTIRSSSLPGKVGLCAADLSAIAQIVNEAQERLLFDPMAPDEGYWGGWVRMAFNVAVTDRHAYITTPQNIARLIVMNVCQNPIKIRNGFYEFLEFAIGSQPRSTSCASSNLSTTCACGTFNQAYERDSVVTLVPQTISPAIIRCYPTDLVDLGKRILIQGLDQNGIAVLGTDVLTQGALSGEYVTLASPFVDTVNSFTSLTGFLKDVTNGPVTIHQVDPTTGDESALSAMDPNETTALYRKYLVDGLPNNCCNTTGGTVQIEAQAKLDFVPVKVDSDYTLIQNLPALIEEVQAIRYSTIDSATATTLENKHHARALNLLFGQIDHYMGKVNTAIKIPIFGSDRLIAQPM